MSSHKTIFRFFLTYLCVLLPVLMLNFIAQRAVLHQTQRRTDETILWQLQQVSDEILTLQQRTDDYAIRLGTDDALTFYRVQGSQTDARKAINLLNDAVRYEDTLSDLFVFYNTGYIYSTAGKTNTATFFSSHLALDDASCARAIELLFSGEGGASCLWTRSGQGYLCIHTPINRLQMSYETISLNFLMPLTSLTQAMTQISSSALNRLDLKLSDGSGACFVQGEDGAVSAVKSETWAEGTPELFVPFGDGATITAHYSHKQMYGDIRRTQSISTVLLCIGMLTSTYVSLVLSRRRYNQLHQVEEYVQGASEEPYGEEFGIILSQFRQLRDRQSDLERSLNSHRSSLRSQIAPILFESSSEISDGATLESLLHECGVTLGEEYFYVGALCLSSPTVNLTGAPLEGRLFCEIRLSGRRVLLFLGEVPHGDDAQTLRRTDAQPLLDKFRGWAPVIAASQVYQPLTMISFACHEALSRLAQAMAAGEDGFVCCLPPENEKEHAPRDRAWFNTDQLSDFATTLTRSDWAEAAALLDSMMADIEAHSGAAEGDYLRGCIVQAALPVFQEAGRTPTVQALNALDPQSPDFASAFRDILRACREPDAEKNDIFNRVVQFVEAHYVENDLSYERVAEYAGVSKTYLSRLFRANVGMSYIEYLSRIRLTRADELIRTSDMTLRDITHAVGYLDESSFRRKYRAFFGYSVTDVRRAHPDTESEE